MSRRSCSAKTAPLPPSNTSPRTGGMSDRHDRLPAAARGLSHRRPGHHHPPATWTCTASSASMALSVGATSRSGSRSGPPAISTTISSPSSRASPATTRPGHRQQSSPRRRRPSPRLTDSSWQPARVRLPGTVGLWTHNRALRLSSEAHGREPHRLRRRHRHRTRQAPFDVVAQLHRALDELADLELVGPGCLVTARARARCTSPTHSSCTRCRPERSMS